MSLNLKLNDMNNLSNKKRDRNDFSFSILSLCDCNPLSLPMPTLTASSHCRQKGPN